MARRTKEDACATRNSLLDAAEQVFYEQGVARASLNEIAQRAGATRGAVYWHFKDKLDLFYAMLDRVTLPLEQAAYGEDVGGARLEGLARVRHVIASVFVRLEEDSRTRKVFEVLLHKVEYVGELVSVQERNVEAMAEFDAKLEAALVRAQSEQKMELLISAAEAALALRCLFDGVIQSWLLARGSFDLSGVGMRAVDAYLRGLGFTLRT
ncbi:MAG: TetR family transcriptional regulator [Comamonas sp.]